MRAVMTTYMPRIYDDDVMIWKLSSHYWQNICLVPRIFVSCQINFRRHIVAVSKSYPKQILLWLISIFLSCTLCHIKSNSYIYICIILQGETNTMLDIPTGIAKRIYVFPVKYPARVLCGTCSKSTIDTMLLILKTNGDKTETETETETETDTDTDTDTDTYTDTDTDGRTHTHTHMNLESSLPKIYLKSILVHHHQVFERVPQVPVLWSSALLFSEDATQS